MLYYPVATVLAEAVTADGRPSLAPLTAILGDPFYRDLLAFTAWQALLSTLASLALGLPGAYVLARYEFPGRATLRSLTAVPFVLPSILVAVGFVATFGARGAVNDALRALGLPTLSLVFTLEIIVLAHAFYNAPLVVRIVGAAAERVDVRAVETARACGAGPWRAARDVVAPQVSAGVFTAALLAFVFSFQSFAVVLALGGLRLATVEVWIFSLVRGFDLAEAAALATVEAAVSLAFTYAYLRFEARQAAASTDHPPRRRSPRRASRPAKAALAAYGAVVAVVFGLPLASMVAESLTGANGVTLRYYAFLLERQTATVGVQTRPLAAVRNSLLFGAGTLAVAVPLGVTIAVLTDRGGRLARLADTAAFLPFAVSGIVVGLGTLQALVFGTTLLGHRFVVSGPVAIVAAHAVGAYPFVTRNVAPLLGRLDPALVESARACGAGRLRALLDVELPLVAGGVLAGAAFAFAISIGEFDATVILAEGSDSYTMPVAVQRYLSERSLGPPTAMGTVLLAVTAASFVAIDRLGGVFGG
ncbi:iron ABC transporter permease [Halobacteriales archaeon QS_5_70_17]|nr:MAG: iron ABC transporter permease [Halobacteriales archaeon QS_5_70_17]